MANKSSSNAVKKEPHFYGMLDTISVELAYETRAELERAMEINKSLGGMARVMRAATDWGFERYDTQPSNLSAEKRAKLERRLPATKFENGDLVKIFKTVADGDVKWQGTVKIKRTDKNWSGTQDGVAKDTWAGMFHDRLPAKVVRKDGTTMFGALEPFFEQGMEYVAWSLHEYGKTGYDGLNVLEDGDELTVYSCVRDGDVAWEGKIDFGDEGMGKAKGMEIMRMPRHMDVDRWLELSWNRCPVKVTRQKNDITP